MSNETGTAADLVRLVGAYVAGGGPAAVSSRWDAIVTLADRNRLAPLLHRQAKARPDVPEAARAQLRDAATRSFMAASNQAKALPELAAALSACPWVLLRGPVLGVLLYGDVALRPFIDLDLLVARDDVPRAAAALRGLGFADHEGALPDAYYLRHHLHLHLVRSRGAARVNLELHWAVDHPFRLVTEDVPGIVARAVPVTVGDAPVPAPAPVDLLLTLAQHTVKHVIDLPQRTVAGDVLGLVERGELLHVLDVALLLARFGTALDRDVVRSRAQEWAITGTVRTCLDAVDLLWPGLPCGELRAALPATRVGRLDGFVARSLAALPERAFRTRRQLFFRPARLLEAVRYVVPPAAAMRTHYGDARMHRRVVHALRAITRLVAGSVELAYYSLAARASRSRSQARPAPPGAGG